MISAPKTISVPKIELVRSRVNIFNLMRLLLAIMVIFSHSYPLLYGVKVFDPFEHLTRAQRDLPTDHPIDAGHLAVYGFFIISGFLVTMSWKNSRGLGKYLKSRVLRICPGFAAAVLVCAFALAPLMAVHPATYYHDLIAGKREFFLALLLLKGVWTPPVVCGALNGSLWTISYEFSCYLTIALLGSVAYLSRPALSSRLQKIAPALFFAGVYTLYCLHCNGHLLGTFGLMNSHIAWIESSHWGRRVIFVCELGGDPITWSRQFAYFAAGMCLYLYKDVLFTNRLLPVFSGAILFVSAFLLPFMVYTLPLFGSYALISLCLLPSQPLSRIGQKADFSYGLYLYAFPIQQLVIYFFLTVANVHLTIGLLFVLALAVTTLFATASWYLVEKPFLALKSKRKWPLKVAAIPEPVKL